MLTKGVPKELGIPFVFHGDCNKGGDNYKKRNEHMVNKIDLEEVK